MNRLKLFLAILALPTASFAQGTMLFTWHGNNNYFQASFQCTLDETLPGSIFNSTLWTNSIQVTSLDGLTYRASDQQPAPYIAGNFGPPLSFTYIFADQNTESSIHVVVVPFQGAAIYENSPLPNGHNAEQGLWSYEVVPEPSSVSLAALAAIVWFGKANKA